MVKTQKSSIDVMAAGTTVGPIPSSGFPTRYSSNRPAISLKLAAVLKFRIENFLATCT